MSQDPRADQISFLFDLRGNLQVAYARALRSGKTREQIATAGGYANPSVLEKILETLDGNAQLDDIAELAFFLGCEPLFDLIPKEDLINEEQPEKVRIPYKCTLGDFLPVYLEKEAIYTSLYESFTVPLEGISKTRTMTLAKEGKITALKFRWTHDKIEENFILPVDFAFVFDEKSNRIICSTQLDVALISYTDGDRMVYEVIPREGPVTYDVGPTRSAPIILGYFWGWFTCTIDNHGMCLASIRLTPGTQEADLSLVGFKPELFLEDFHQLPPSDINTPKFTVSQ